MRKGIVIVKRATSMGTSVDAVYGPFHGEGESEQFAVKVADALGLDNWDGSGDRLELEIDELTEPANHFGWEEPKADPFGPAALLEFGRKEMSDALDDVEANLAEARTHVTLGTGLGNAIHRLRLLLEQYREVISGQLLANAQSVTVTPRRTPVNRAAAAAETRKLQVAIEELPDIDLSARAVTSALLDGVLVELGRKGGE